MYQLPCLLQGSGNHDKGGCARETAVVVVFRLRVVKTQVCGLGEVRQLLIMAVFALWSVTPYALPSSRAKSIADHANAGWEQRLSMIRSSSIIICTTNLLTSSQLLQHNTLHSPIVIFRCPRYHSLAFTTSTFALCQPSARLIAFSELPVPLVCLKTQPNSNPSTHHHPLEKFSSTSNVAQVLLLLIVVLVIHSQQFGPEKKGLNARLLSFDIAAWRLSTSIEVALAHHPYLNPKHYRL